MELVGIEPMAFISVLKHLKVGSQYDARTSVVLRSVKRQIVNTFSYLRATASVDAQRNAGVEKISTLASANVCSVGPIRIIYFHVITCALQIVLALVRTYVAIDEEKLIVAYALFHACGRSQ